MLVFVGHGAIVSQVAAVIGVLSMCYPLLPHLDKNGDIEFALCIKGLGVH
jgi:hypothetical protein